MSAPGFFMPAIRNIEAAQEQQIVAGGKTVLRNRRPLRVLFALGDESAVERCVHELDVFRTPHREGAIPG